MLNYSILKKSSDTLWEVKLLYEKRMLKWYGMPHLNIVAHIDRGIHLSNLILLHSLTAFQRKLHKFEYMVFFFPDKPYALEYQIYSCWLFSIIQYFSFKNYSIGAVLELFMGKSANQNLWNYLHIAFTRAVTIYICLYTKRGEENKWILDAEQNI